MGQTSVYKNVLIVDPFETHNVKILIQRRPLPRLLSRSLFNEWTSVTKPLKTRTVHKKLLHFVDLYPKEIPTHISVWHKVEICWENFCLSRSHLKKKMQFNSTVSCHKTSTRHSFWKEDCALLNTCFTLKQIPILCFDSDTPKSISKTHN